MTDTAEPGPPDDEEVRRILDFERAHPHPAQGAKDSAIWETFGVRPTRYYQRLLALVGSDHPGRDTGDPRAWTYDAQTCKRVRRVVAEAGARRRPGRPRT